MNTRHRVHGYLKEFNKELWILSTGLLVSALGFAVSIPFISIYFYSTLHLSLSQIGLFFSVLAVVRAGVQILGGELSDYIAREALLIHAQILRAGTFFLLAAAIHWNWGFWAVAATLLFSSIFGAVFQPAANAMVSDILPAEKRLDGYAVARSAGNLGWAVGPAIGGFLSVHSVALPFFVSSGLTLLSGLIFAVFLKTRHTAAIEQRFSLADLLSIRKDPYLARHCLLVFLLYVVVAQLIAPFSVYTVEVAGISKRELGLLYMLNGFMIVALQMPVTRLLSTQRRLLSLQKLTIQLAVGAFFYAAGYGMLGMRTGFGYFALAVFVVTLGEIFISPPSLVLTSRLAPEGRMGRYMGVYGFFFSGGWSLGPVYGGVVLDHFAHRPALAWMLIGSLALCSGIGYLLFTRRLPDSFNTKPEQPGSQSEPSA